MNTLFKKIPYCVLIVCFTLFLGSPIVAQQGSDSQKRIALIIGNSNYRTGGLNNPTHDADTMEAALQSVGFQVTKTKDRSKSEMESDIDSITKNLNSGDVCMIFFAGHGMEIARQNYLVPIDAEVTREHHVKQRCVNVSYLLDALEFSEASLKIVIADCCRDNPFRGFVRSGRAGLSKPGAAPDGTIISFSTSSGTTAADGRGKNSPFTKYLAKALETERKQGLEIVDLFRIAGQGVKEEMGQRPFLEFDVSMKDFYLRAPDPTLGSPTPLDERIKMLTLLGEKKLSRELYDLWNSLDRRRGQLSEDEQKQLRSLDRVARGEITPDEYSIAMSNKPPAKTPVEPPAKNPINPAVAAWSLPPAAAFSGRLEGTKWRFTDSDQDNYQILFLDDGTAHYQHKRGPRKNGTWSLDRGTLTISINDYTTLTGTLDGRAMSGSANNIAGEKWNFNATPVQ